MEDYPKSVLLKDGLPVELRPLRATDAEGLYAFFCDLPEEDRQFLRDDVTDRAVIDRWTSAIAPERVLAILALRGGRIVGDATLHVEERGWTRHLGEIRCVVARELQNQGLGTQLVAALMKHAIRRGLKKVCVTMMDCQQSVHGTFERIGFRRSAVLPGHVLDKHGAEHDLIVMTNNIDDVWRRMEALVHEMDSRGGRS